ncbi:MAG TPA: VTT domain-containing protein [Candidatus Eremiobacteraceae bacterium]|nr:VTT domain-containing protein [Candidatus Eremiobacteraceae bacterium]
MPALLDTLLRHGYLFLAGWVFLEQIGLPLPSLPLLLASGALVGAGRMNFAAALFSCAVASLTADVLWYELGRRKGIRIVQWLCRISLEPDSCVRRTEGIFEKQGAKSLLIAKFLPGLNAVATPLAGIFQMRPARFLLFDLLGVLFWAGSCLGLGYFFTRQIEAIARRAQSLGSWLVVVLASGLALYILYKFLARQKFLRDLRISRISVDELKQKLDAGEPLSIVDLRHSLDFEADPQTIPGAVHLDSKDLTEKNNLLQLDREVVLYCT